MVKRGEKNRRNLPSSGDRLTDWFFKRLLDVYEREVTAVRKKRKLTDPSSNEPRKILCGLLIAATGEIYLNPDKVVTNRKGDSIVSTFIHELSHTLTLGVWERHIRQLENILWLKFTDAQKKVLRKLIPRHEVKKGPELPEPEENKK